MTSLDPAETPEAQPTEDAAPAATAEPAAPAQDVAQDAAQPEPETDAAALAAQLEAALAERDTAGDRALRAQAELENYKRRVQKEHADSLRYALTPLVAEVAAILDNLERAMAHAPEEEPSADGDQALREGIAMVVKQTREALERFGVTRIEAAGRPFDPNLHEAMNVVETDAVPENQVLDEYQAGYLLHDRVVRPARVSVSKRATATATDSAPAGN